MDARNSHGVREKFSWALTFTAVVAACLALAECGGWAQGSADAQVAAQVQQQIQRLGSQDANVRYVAASALGTMGPDAKEAVPALITVFRRDTDANVRYLAAAALGFIGPGAKEAVPALITALAMDKDPDQDLRGEAAIALGGIGPGAKEALPALITALAKDTKPNVRGAAAIALGQVSAGTKEAAPALITAFAKDTDPGVRHDAAMGLGEIGLVAKEAIPALTTALAKDPEPKIRGAAAYALTQFAEAALDSKRTDMIEQLTQWAQALEASSFPTDAAQVRTAIFVLRAIRAPWYEVLYEKASGHPIWVGLVAAYLFLALLWLTLLWKSPLSLWRINEVLEHIPRVKLPGSLGGVEISVAYLCLVGFFHYHPRVLDAWVSRRITAARDQFGRIATVQQREVYVDVPVELDRKVSPGLKADDLKPAFTRNRTFILIWGEGGAGKTSLACQIARWGMSDDPAMRPCAQPMLPVMIEQDLDLDVDQGKAVLTEMIRGELKKSTGEADAPDQEMVRHLLRQKRLLLIVDGLSELNQASRKKLRLVDPSFAANALIVTSRVEESLDGVEKTIIHPLRIQGDRLSSFMEAYLVLRGRRSLFRDAEFFDGCRKLSEMVGDREITVLLAKLYAEQLIASKENVKQNLPENIPDLMLQYLNELNHKEGLLTDRAVHSTAKSIAWECLKETFRPAPAKIDAVLAAIGGDSAQDRINYLERNLRLVQVTGSGRDRVKFALDPLAEYLAGLYVVEHYGDNEQLWRDFLAKTDSVPDAPGAIKGFLLAVRDCCLTPDAERNVPSFVAIELASRASLDLQRSETGIAV